MRDFRKLKIWEQAHQLALVVYRVTGGFPKEELYGMTSQIRRAAVSVPSNIAEGCGRDGDKELARYIQISAGSLSELDYQLELAHDLQFLNQADFADLTGRIINLRKMLRGFQQTLLSGSYEVSEVEEKYMVEDDNKLEL